MSAVNETLIRDVVAEVLGRLGNGATTATSKPSPAPAPAPKSDSCGCSVKKSSAVPALRGKFGVFATAEEAFLSGTTRDGDRNNGSGVIFLEKRNERLHEHGLEPSGGVGDIGLHTKIAIQVNGVVAEVERTTEIGRGSDRLSSAPLRLDRLGQGRIWIS